MQSDSQLRASKFNVDSSPVWARMRPQQTSFACSTFCSILTPPFAARQSNGRCARSAPVVSCCAVRTVPGLSKHAIPSIARSMTRSFGKNSPLASTTLDLRQCSLYSASTTRRRKRLSWPNWLRSALRAGIPPRLSLPFRRTARGEEDMGSTAGRLPRAATGSTCPFCLDAGIRGLT
jgi:hypothetical protein